VTHQRCYRCGRLLVPVNGHMPYHRKPPPRPAYYTSSTPLTGKDSPWCEGGR
jgi:hypothetical protein